MIKRDNCKMFLCICLVIWSGALAPALAQGELDNASDSSLYCAKIKIGLQPRLYKHLLLLMIFIAGLN